MENLTIEKSNNLINHLKARFETNMQRHQNLDWTLIHNRLNSNSGKIRALNEMEKTGGEPDVIGYDEQLDAFVFCDCSIESPTGRRSLCYDAEALKSRKELKPKSSAIEMAKDMGIELLSEKQYRKLQQFGNFDTKTSSWINTPESIRKSGGALFGDFRYGSVFIYHNGAQSYYATRGFRGILYL